VRRYNKVDIVNYNHDWHGEVWLFCRPEWLSKEAPQIAFPISSFSVIIKSASANLKKKSASPND
jgi:hypothetical protein